MSRNLRIVIASTALLGVIASCALLMWLPRAPQWLANRRWDNRPFENYRMVVDVTMYTQFCKYDIIVHGDEIVTVNENWCDRYGLFYTVPLDAQTVDDLFRDLSNQWQGLKCGSGNCRCGHPVVLGVQYDDELGYPVEWSLQRVELGVDLMPPCAVDIGEGPLWSISKLEPLD